MAHKAAQGQALVLSGVLLVFQQAQGWQAMSRTKRAAKPDTSRKAAKRVAPEASTPLMVRGFPVALRQQAKARAALEGLSFGALVVSAVRAYCASAIVEE